MGKRWRVATIGTEQSAQREISAPRLDHDGGQVCCLAVGLVGL